MGRRGVFGHRGIAEHSPTRKGRVDLESRFNMPSGVRGNIASMWLDGLPVTKSIRPVFESEISSPPGPLLLVNSDDA